MQSAVSKLVVFPLIHSFTVGGRGGGGLKGQEAIGHTFCSILIQSSIQHNSGLTQHRTRTYLNMTEAARDL